MTLGETLRAARVAKRLSQRQAAMALGFTRASINAWERGKSRPSFDKLQKMVNFYGITVEVSPEEAA